ncbi:MAG: 3-keto-disaccharide hydrolase, partial [Planctomycetota bacterium]
VDRRAGDLVSLRAFGDCLLHVEWLSPPSAEAVDPAGGNSGVKLQERYEIQILNTPGPPHVVGAREAGSIYGVKAADRNASTGPGTWQTYDVWFTAPRWRDGRKIAPARVTMLWNGVLVHEDVEVPAKTGVSVDEAPGAHPVLLQAHSSSAAEEVRFRNVWVLPDPEAAGVPAPRRPRKDGP